MSDKDYTLDFVLHTWLLECVEEILQKPVPIQDIVLTADGLRDEDLRRGQKHSDNLVSMTIGNRKEAEIISFLLQKVTKGPLAVYNYIQVKGLPGDIVLSSLGAPRFELSPPMGTPLGGMNVGYRKRVADRDYVAILEEDCGQKLVQELLYWQLRQQVGSQCQKLLLARMMKRIGVKPKTMTVPHLMYWKDEKKSFRIENDWIQQENPPLVCLGNTRELAKRVGCRHRVQTKDSGLSLWEFLQRCAEAKDLKFNKWAPISLEKDLTNLSPAAWMDIRDKVDIPELKEMRDNMKIVFELMGSAVPVNFFQIKLGYAYEHTLCVNSEGSVSHRVGISDRDPELVETYGRGKNKELAKLQFMEACLSFLQEMPLSLFTQYYLQHVVAVSSFPRGYFGLVLPWGTYRAVADTENNTVSVAMAKLHVYDAKTEETIVL